MTEFPAPKEELLTVAIDDTAYAVFFTGITRFFCHNSSFFLYLSYIHEMDQGITGNLRVILIIHGVTEQQEIFPVLSARYKDEGDFLRGYPFLMAMIITNVCGDLDRHAIKLCDDLFFLVYHNAKCG